MRSIVVVLSLGVSLKVVGVTLATSGATRRVRHFYVVAMSSKDDKTPKLIHEQFHAQRDLNDTCRSIMRPSLRSRGVTNMWPGPGLYPVRHCGYSSACVGVETSCTWASIFLTLRDGIGESDIREEHEGAAQ